MCRQDILIRCRNIQKTARAIAKQHKSSTQMRFCNNQMYHQLFDNSHSIIVPSHNSCHLHCKITISNREKKYHRRTKKSCTFISASWVSSCQHAAQSAPRAEALASQYWMTSQEKQHNRLTALNVGLSTNDLYHVEGGQKGKYTICSQH